MKKVIKKFSGEKVNYEAPALVLGILSIIFSATFVSPFAGLVCGIIGWTQTRKPKSKMARQARILSIIGVSISIILAVIALVLVSNANYIPA